MATTDTANFYYNFSITDPYEKRNENFHINKSLPATYVFCCFHPWPTGNALVFVILSFYMKLKTLTETDNTFAECGYS